MAARAGDPLDLFGEQRIVRDISLRLLREAVGVVELLASASLMISGSASCRAQRTFALRCAHHAKPPAATASATTAAASRVRRDVRGRAIGRLVRTTVAHGRPMQDRALRLP